ncbi:hypothetical protein A6R68_13598, partial [Neotoma lepida]
MSTMLEEPTDFDQSGTRVTATSLGHCAGDASEKFKEDDTVPGPTSADSSTDQQFPGLSICAPGGFIPIPSHEDCPRHSPYPKISPRLSNSTKNVLRRVPFPEGDIRYSLSELDGLRSIPSAKGRLTSSMYAQKDSSPTSARRSIPPPTSSELSFRSSSPPKEDLRYSPSPQGGSRHSKLKKTKSRRVSKEADLKSVPLEDGGLKVHHSSKKGGKVSISDKGARASPLLLLPRETADLHDLMRRATEVLHLLKVSLDIPNLPSTNWKRFPLTKQMFKLPVHNTRAVTNPL